MPNYKESSVSGSSWQRSYQVTINNKYNEIPSIVFYEEEIVDTGSGTMSKHVGHIADTMSDPSKVFNLVDPTTGSVIGSTTYQNAYVLLSSLYLALAAARDSA